MSQEQILFPAFAVALLTFGIGFWLRVLISKAVREGLNPAYFKLNYGGKPPAHLLQVRGQFENLFETPMLFYAVLIMIYVTHQTGPVLLGLAWLYVALRLLHAYVHTTSNDLRYRGSVFLASVTVLFALWLGLLIDLLKG